MVKLPHQVAPWPIEDDDVATKGYTDVSGAGGGGYERCASFGVPVGSSTRAAFLGPAITTGSLIGLSAWINEPVTSGSITVNTIVAGSNTLQAVLNTTDDVYKVVTVPEWTWPIGNDERVVVEVVASGYQHAAGQVDGGLVVNLAFVSSAEFYLLRVNSAGGGEVVSSPPGISIPGDAIELYSPGTVVTLTATPDPGHRFVGWTGGGCSGTGTCIQTMTSSSSVTAVFALCEVPTVIETSCMVNEGP